MLGVEEVLKEVLVKVTPRREEYEKVWSLITRLCDKLKGVAEEHSLKIDVEVEGSVAKDTWLAGNRDIDIFMLFPKSLPEDFIRKYGLLIAREAVKRVGGSYYETYAYHPYIKGLIEGYEVDIVPAYRVEPHEVLTPVDRTPYHTRYVISKLTQDMKNDVRLLKQFMKGIGVYGAEIKVGGFSGYLCELLVIHYGSFLNVLRNAMEWRPWRTVIDIEGYYSQQELRRLRKVFGNSPLIIIDPVDKTRNAAAAVSLQRLCEFKAAARMFLENPSIEFFFPPPPKLLKPEDYERLRLRRGSTFLVIEIPCPKLPPDILWGEVYRSLRGLRRLLEKYEFSVLSQLAWSDEKSVVLFFYEVHSDKLPVVEKHVGPPIGAGEREESFLRKYLIENAEEVFAGPFIEGGSWIVFKRRKISDLKTLLSERSLEAKHGTHIREIFAKKQHRVYVNEEVEEILRRHERDDFNVRLSQLLSGTYSWLKVACEEVVNEEKHVGN